MGHSRETAEGDILITVSKTSNVQHTGTAIIKALQEGRRLRKEVVVRAIAAGAVNQAVKAIAFARGILASSYGVNLACQIFFHTINEKRPGFAEATDCTVMTFQLIDLSRTRSF